ncbi:hypothetical protein [Streptomyces sp. NPDC005533]|uniref:hypothetical protein n=1 Tax=Streptomyces sp. NPDC005533 TaxID=3364723 RepID=UPI0036C563FD
MAIRLLSGTRSTAVAAAALTAISVLLTAAPAQARAASEPCGTEVKQRIDGFQGSATVGGVTMTVAFREGFPEPSVSSEETGHRPVRRYTYVLSDTGTSGGDGYTIKWGAIFPITWYNAYQSTMVLCEGSGDSRFVVQMRVHSDVTGNTYIIDRNT